jgi:double-stranded uracil-DNA glycosylase
MTTPRRGWLHHIAVPQLHDILPPRPKILFVGINPGLRSWELGHHFAGKGNPFWRLLFAAGLTPTELTAEEDARLAELGMGLTNLCRRPTRSAAELSRAEMDRGVVRLGRLVLRLRPGIVAFVGLSIYQRYFGRKVSGGAGAKRERIGSARVFVLPNPSGLNASFPGFEHKLRWFKALARVAD